MISLRRHLTHIHTHLLTEETRSAWVGAQAPSRPEPFALTTAPRGPQWAACYTAAPKVCCSHFLPSVSNKHLLLLTKLQPASLCSVLFLCVGDGTNRWQVISIFFPFHGFSPRHLKITVYSNSHLIATSDFLSYLIACINPSSDNLYYWILN